MPRRASTLAANNVDVLRGLGPQILSHERARPPRKRPRTRPRLPGLRPGGGLPVGGARVRGRGRRKPGDEGTGGAAPRTGGRAGTAGAPAGSGGAPSAGSGGAPAAGSGGPRPRREAPRARVAAAAARPQAPAGPPARRGGDRQRRRERQRRRARQARRRLRAQRTGELRQGRRGAPGPADAHAGRSHRADGVPGGSHPGLHRARGLVRHPAPLRPARQRSLQVRERHLHAVGLSQRQVARHLERDPLAHRDPLLRLQDRRAPVVGRHDGRRRQRERVRLPGEGRAGPLASTCA
jgi:hypothetical protein